MEPGDPSGPEAVAATQRSGMPKELDARHLVARVFQLVAIGGVVVVAISAVPGLDEIRARLVGANPVWVGALVVAELGSCAGYVLVSRAMFCSQMEWGLSYDIAMPSLQPTRCCRPGARAVWRSAFGRCAKPACPLAISRVARWRSSWSRARRTS
jgi:hypothetical protein